jgi:type IV pilus biogenesis protein CpaD/CtpE
MCQLCSGDQEAVITERRRMMSQADRLEGLAKRIRSHAEGRLKVHSDDGKNTGVMARNLIRDLVADWL